MGVPERGWYLTRVLGEGYREFLCLAVLSCLQIFFVHACSFVPVITQGASLLRSTFGSRKQARRALIQHTTRFYTTPLLLKRQKKILEKRQVALANEEADELARTGAMKEDAGRARG